jgi:hypothetical protein
MNSNRRKFLTDASLMTAALMLGKCAHAGTKTLPESCALNGSLNDYGFSLDKTSGNSDLDRSINAELFHLSERFKILPGFGFFDEGRPNQANAFATVETYVSGTNGTVVFGKYLLGKEMASSDYGGLAVAGIMAHEFAHIFQFQTDYYQRLTQNQPTHKLLELHADYLAGYYLGLKLAQEKEIDIKVFLDSLYAKGDTNFYSKTHHGTPIDRIECMLNGYKQGIKNNGSIGQIAEKGFNFVTALS